MKKISFFKYCLLAVMAISMVAFTGCKDDDDDDDPPVFVEDGFYLTGPATGTDGFELNAMMFPGREEGEGFSYNLRDGMFEKFFYLNTGTFNITEVAGATRTTWGWDGNGQQQLELDGTNDQILGTVHHGTVTGDGTAFNVATAGFYHVIVDKSTATALFTRITHWAAIGDATDLGWSGEYKMDPVSVTAEEGTWKGSEIVIRERGGIKFRYNSGWKISYPNTTDPEFIIFSNIGNDNGDWVMGAGSFAHPTPEGEYDVTLNWSLSDGWDFEYNKTGDVEPLPDIETLFIVGTINDWSEADPLYMEPGDNAVFKGYQYITDSDMIKFLPTKGTWAGNFGSPAAGTDGTVTDDNNADVNLSELDGFDGDGFYEIRVDIANNTITITKINTLGVIGDATPGSWDSSTPLAWDADEKVWEGVITFEGTGMWKFRANDAWDINWGGELDNLVLGGGDLATPGAGNYVVTLSLSGTEKFFATVVAE